MDQSILEILKPLADAAGISMVWLNATAVNVMVGTGAVKSTWAVKGYWNLLTAGVICLAMAFANFYAVPVTALVAAVLVFAGTAGTLAGLKEGRKAIKGRPELLEG
jgi:hypothetical protein